MENLFSQFEIRSPDYLEKFSVFDNQTSFNQIISPINDLKKNDLQICDVMCGTGILGKQVAKRFSGRIKRIVFTDGSSKMLSSLSDSFEKFECLVQNLPFKDGEFDVVVCRYGINNLSKKDYPDCIKELLRILKKGGVLVIQDIFPKERALRNYADKLELFISNKENNRDNPYIMLLDDFKSMVEKNGGKIIGEDGFIQVWSVKERFSAKDIDFDFKEIVNFLKTIDENLFYVEVFDKSHTKVRGTLRASKSPEQTQGPFDIREKDIFVRSPIKTLSIVRK